MIKKICPRCYSTSVRIRPGHQIYREGNILMTPDYGEVHFCEKCGYHGVQVIEGNEVLIKFLKERPFGKKERKELKQEIHEKRNPAFYEPTETEDNERTRSILGMNFKIPASHKYSKIIEC